MENMALKVGGQSNDLEFDGNGIMETVYGSETTAQNVRMALTAWKNDFLPVPAHGTDYRQFFSGEAGETERMEIVRDAVFQEEDIAQVEKITVTEAGGRKVHVSFEGRTRDGSVIGTEVDA